MWILGIRRKQKELKNPKGDLYQDRK